MKLTYEFEMKDLGETQSFLGIKFGRDRKRKTLTLTLEEYTTNVLKRLGFSETRPQRTPMVTNQVANRNRRDREENVSRRDEKVTLENIPYR